MQYKPDIEKITNLMCLLDRKYDYSIKMEFELYVICYDLK